MKLLLDECLPRKLKFDFEKRGHSCQTVRDAGFGSKENGELLDAADGLYDVLITIDKNIRHQQNLTGRRISILVLRAKSNDIDDLRPQIAPALLALEKIEPGQIVEVRESL
ncbi:MAG TPA: DUF5615 family PIN-like protein [Candidatus Acidoferrum sp.]|nr:DUF5615 family PIN-like protein [Candidatus Acidoferrum sp.]